MAKSSSSTPWAAEPAPAPEPTQAAAVEGQATTEPSAEMPALDTPEKVLAYLKDNPSVLQMMSKQEIIAMFAGAAAAEEAAQKVKDGEAKGD